MYETVFPSFLITFREALEAALIVTIMITYLRKIGKEELNKYTYLGTGAALVMSLVAGVVLQVFYGGLGKVVAGKPLPPELRTENLEALEKGFVNLAAHIEIAKKFGVPVVVAVNRFTDDTDNEVKLLEKLSVDAGASAAVMCDVWGQGGGGAIDLAHAVVKACEEPKDFKFLYPLDASIEEKIETIAREVYGADGVTFLPEAKKKIRLYTKLGYDKLPICMAKTHLSLSHDLTLKGRPKGFRVPIRDIRASLGAGFLYPLLGEMRTMPGLSADPAYQYVDIDETGKIKGLF